MSRVCVVRVCCECYRDFDHVGDEGASHDTGKQAQYEVVHLPAAGPVY